MGGKHTGANYDLAKAEADKVDAQIIETLKTGHSFRVEAGAGSGKTYSLNRVIEWIQSNKWSDYSRKKQNVVCITLQSDLQKIRLFSLPQSTRLLGMLSNNIRAF